MSNYRRTYSAGSTVFLTWVAYRRAPLFSHPETVALFRQSVRKAKREADFQIVAAAVLPDHLHFIWTLPPDDHNYSKRVGRIKVLFTRALRGHNAQPETISPSRRKHRESDVWQRRFWEHTLRSKAELSRYFDYVHYNPVKRGLVKCPHQWPYSSFHELVGQGVYQQDWVCQCHGTSTDFAGLLEVGLLCGE